MESWKEIYQIWAQPLYRYLLFLCGDRHLAEELVQETFFQAFKSLYKYRGGKFSAWLYAIARNIYLQEQRKRGKDPGHDLATIDYKTPETIIQAKEEQRQVREALALLPEEQRQVVVLRIYSELDYRAIAEICGRSENWARVNFYRGKAKLAKILKNGEER